MKGPAARNTIIIQVPAPLTDAEPNPAESVPASIGSLYELVALGAITLDEYEAKKNELLARL